MSLLRYIFIQLLAYGIDMGLFLSAVYFTEMGPVIANVIAKTGAGMFAFFGHRAFTFGLKSHQHDPAQMVRYLILLGVNIPLSAAVLWTVLTPFPHPVVAKIVSDIAIILINFWLSRHWVFQKPTKHE